MIDVTNRGRSLMMHHEKRRQDKRPENVIPMINIVFLLLLYFMVAGNLHIDLEVTPPSSSATNEPPPGVPQISVTGSGTILFQGAPITVAQISVELSKYFKGHVVQISADAASDAVLVAKVIEALGEAGSKHVSLLSLRK